MFRADILRDALNALGILLHDQGLTYEIVVIGAGALLLRGDIQRPTEDLDAVALVGASGYETAEPLPPPLVAAVEAIRASYALAERWLNGEPTPLLRNLPHGFATRTSTQVFGSLVVRIPSRFDLICLKLLAAVGDAPRSKHRRDLVEMSATRDELDAAQPWVVEQEAAEDFSTVVQEFIDVLVSDAGR